MLTRTLYALISTYLMSSRPTISRLDHVALHVNDLERARKFYEDVLGWTASETSDEVRSRGIVWYELPDGRQVHLFQTDDFLPINRAHLALLVDDVPGWHAFFVESGIEIVEPSVSLYNAERFFVRDPSGNLIEFVKWN